MFLANSHDHWQAQFVQERTRLLAALGELTEGGVVEHVQHIGATSVPGLPARPCIDIGLSVWPFPLEARCRAALESLGYTFVSGHEDAAELRLRHATGPRSADDSVSCTPGTGDFQLWIAEAGTERWTNYLLVRDHLSHDAEARRTYAARKQAWATEGDRPSTEVRTVKAQAFAEMIDAAGQWWVRQHGFAPVEAVADELKDFGSPWYISSGWALDLFLGQVTRVHHDVDVVVSRGDQLALQQRLTARDWKLLTPFEHRLEPWPSHMRLELPRHQVHAHRDGAFIDLLLADVEPGVWRYRREPTIIRAVDRMSLRTEAGIPFLAPELVLLFKSKNTSDRQRRKDEADFERVHPRLEPERRAWLRWALMATNSTHPWLERLV
jgi:GrpB-like predicted nucleotidyltransferase (UPF0157 family)